MPLADIAFLVRSAPVSGPFGGGTDGLLSADFVAKVFAGFGEG